MLPESHASPDRKRRPFLLLVLVLVALLGVGGYVAFQLGGDDRAPVANEPAPETDQPSTEAYQPWFAGYTDLTATPVFTFETPDSESGRDVVLSFIVAATTDACTPTWGTYYTLDEAVEGLDLDRRLARAEQLGGQVIVSFGGLLNDELSTGCTDPARLVAAYEEVIDRYGVSTIDLDIEGGNLRDTVAGERRAAAMATLQENRTAAGTDLAVWLTLPVSPAGMTEDGATAVSQMLEAGVDLAGVNLMTMDYGASRASGDSMAEASIAALQSSHRQLGTLYRLAGIELTAATLWTKIGATPMIGQNDVAGEIFSLADAAQFNAFAQENRIGRMSVWSLNRDQTCGSDYVDLTRVSNSCSGVDQGDQRFSDVLAQGFDSRPTSAAPIKTTDEADQIGDLTDDPATSPYPIWTEGSTYLADTQVVWHRNVYQAKWWTLGDLPDAPVLNEWETPWTLIGPVD